jgi:predicted esterase
MRYKKRETVKGRTVEWHAVNMGREDTEEKLKYLHVRPFYPNDETPNIENEKVIVTAPWFTGDAETIAVGSVAPKIEGLLTRIPFLDRLVASENLVEDLAEAISTLPVISMFNVFQGLTTADSLLDVRKEERSLFENARKEKKETNGASCQGWLEGMGLSRFFKDEPYEECREDMADDKGFGVVVADVGAWATFDKKKDKEYYGRLMEAVVADLEDKGYKKENMIFPAYSRGAYVVAAGVSGLEGKFGGLFLDHPVLDAKSAAGHGFVTQFIFKVASFFCPHLQELYGLTEITLSDAFEAPIILSQGVLDPFVSEEERHAIRKHVSEWAAEGRPVATIEDGRRRNRKHIVDTRALAQGILWLENAKGGELNVPEEPEICVNYVKNLQQERIFSAEQRILKN